MFFFLVRKILIGSGGGGKKSFGGFFNLFLAVDMPVEDLGKGLLGGALDGVAVAGDQGGPVPGVDALDALVEAGAVLGAVADGVPEEALVALGGADGGVEGVEDLLEQAAALLLRLGHLGVLLRRGRLNIRSASTRTFSGL